MKKSEPKKIKMPPLVDRSQGYDTMSFCEIDNTLDRIYIHEDYIKNNSESIQKLETKQVD